MPYRSLGLVPGESCSLYGYSTTVNGSNVCELLLIGASLGRRVPSESVESPTEPAMVAFMY